MLAHYSSQEYRLELERNYVDRPGAFWSQTGRCPECDIEISDKRDYTLHIGVVHRAVQQFLPIRYRIPDLGQYEAREMSFPCPLPGCNTNKQTKRALLVHLLIIHYQKDIALLYGPFYKENSRKCPICSAMILQDYITYMKHLAVEHSVVMAFVKRDVGVKKGSAKLTPFKRKLEGGESQQNQNQEHTQKGSNSIPNGKTGSSSEIQKEKETGDTNGEETTEKVKGVRDIRNVIGEDSDSDDE